MSRTCGSALQVLADNPTATWLATWCRCRSAIRRRSNRQAEGCSPGRDDGVFPPSPAVARAVQEAVAALRTQRSGSDRARLPQKSRKQFHTNEAFDLYCSLIGADGGADARRLVARQQARSARRAAVVDCGFVAPDASSRRGRFAATRDNTGWRGSLSHARPRSADGYWQLVDRKNQLGGPRAWRIMRQQAIGAIVCPPHACRRCRT